MNSGRLSQLPKWTPMLSRTTRLVLGMCVAWFISAKQGVAQPEQTIPLELADDPASLMVDGIDRFLLQQTSNADARRGELWQPDFSSADAYLQSVEMHRQNLARMLGVVDQRLTFKHPQVVAEPGNDGAVAKSAGFTVYRICWPVLEDPAPSTSVLPSISGEGLLLIPNGPTVGDVITIPDAGSSPENLAGLTGKDKQSAVAARLAAAGFRVAVPAVMGRDREKRNSRSILTDREYIHRSAFELGRTLA
ncbi:MAG: hypothetical protein KDA96_10285, partial [Planctomycetaceae bacterium]|nr:hypothetical protein [Planctomycetaceae bacterium]